ncbi:hypothetical protein ABT237_35850, partial [Streptomyces sp. NPDC001581]|uniref:hypothetical protein n=1 Tax=Streptomyces sp. NPDC001581 TaxID=3154386 RepID=UPI00333302DF
SGSIRSHIASVITNRTGTSDQLINPSKRHALASITFQLCPSPQRRGRDSGAASAGRVLSASVTCWGEALGTTYPKALVLLLAAKDR